MKAVLKNPCRVTHQRFELTNLHCRTRSIHNNAKQR